MGLEEHEFLHLAQMFIAESGWNLQYDESNARFTYHCYVNDPNSAFISMRESDMVVAVALVTVDYFAHNKPFGYVVKFYVLPAYRNGKYSFKLMELCNSWFSSRDAEAVFFAPHAKIGNRKAMVRLMRRAGFGDKIDLLYWSK